MSVFSGREMSDNGQNWELRLFVDTRSGTRRKAVAAIDGEEEAKDISIKLHAKRKEVFAVCAISFREVEGQPAWRVGFFDDGS